VKWPISTESKGQAIADEGNKKKLMPWWHVIVGELQDNDVKRSTIEKRSYYEKEARAKVFLNSDDDFYYHVEIMRVAFLETIRNFEDVCDQKNFLSALNDAVKILISCNARFVDRIRALASIKEKKSKNLLDPNCFGNFIVLLSIFVNTFEKA